LVAEGIAERFSLGIRGLPFLRSIVTLLRLSERVQRLLRIVNESAYFTEILEISLNLCGKPRVMSAMQFVLTVLSRISASLVISSGLRHAASRFERRGHSICGWI
jgi:hypothetical protein